MPSKGPDYEHTQKLVNIALKSGMTQVEIAKLCRVDQSTVSRWKKGERRATQQQIKPLLPRFGDRMGRPPFQLYQREERRDPQLSASQLFKVDGRLILREAFAKAGNAGNREAMRLSVQEVSRGRFALVLESASGDLPLKQGKGDAIDLRSRDMPWMLKDGNAAVIDQEALIAHTDHIADRYKKDFLGLVRMKLLLALALLNHGYTLEGLETPAMETPDPDSA